MSRLLYLIAAFALAVVPVHLFAAEKPIKAFILAGQSNMVGWGDSTMLTDHLRKAVR